MCERHDVSTGAAQEPEILTYINEHFDTHFTDADKVNHFADDMERRLAAQDGLARALDPVVNPSEQTRRIAFKSFFEDTLEDMIDANFEIYKKIVDDPNFGDLFRAVMFKKIEEGMQ